MCPRCGCRETPAGLCSRCFLGRGCLDGISSRISLALPEGGEKFWHTSGLLCCPDDLHLRKPHLEGKLGETLRDRPTIAHSQYLHSYLMKILSWWFGWFWYQIQGPWLQTHLCTPAIPRESCSRRDLSHLSWLWNGNVIRGSHLQGLLPQHRELEI